ncbi:hypothetical protein Gogos_022065 [Gossypium gossypioides]|uniref:Uncharacterized protein n=1 Tax=Gossypium gossypioides TaxID=34282 RepID=A0A7J9CYQ7_GOSGO|nr:hypothetical protein [Gossypium gossypioides]
MKDLYRYLSGQVSIELKNGNTLKRL